MAWAAAMMDEEQIKQALEWHGKEARTLFCDHCGFLWPCDAFKALTALRETRTMLLEHRADLHQYSTRPCPTCRASAKMLGLTVADTCANPDQSLSILKRYKALQEQQRGDE